MALYFIFSRWSLKRNKERAYLKAFLCLFEPVAEILKRGFDLAYPADLNWS